MKDLLTKPILLFGIFISIVLITFKFGQCKTDDSNSIDLSYFHKNEPQPLEVVFYLEPDLQLLNVQDRKTITLRSLCPLKPKLVFRYFGINCKDCIQKVIDILQDVYDSEFSSNVILLNNSYLKTYMDDLADGNEYYIKDLNNEREDSGLPYFFIISPNSRPNCKIVPVPDVNDLKCIEEKIKSLVY